MSGKFVGWHTRFSSELYRSRKVRRPTSMFGRASNSRGHMTSIKGERNAALITASRKKPRLTWAELGQMFKISVAQTKVIVRRGC